MDTGSVPCLHAPLSLPPGILVTQLHPPSPPDMRMVLKPCSSLGLLLGETKPTYIDL